MKDASSPKEEDVTYRVRVTNKTTGCCHSDTATVVARIYGAPVPNVSDTAHCVGTTAGALSSNVRINQALAGETYTLKYYDSDKTTELTAGEIPSTTAAGVHTYYATQSSATGGESDKVGFKVTVYGVDTALVAQESHPTARTTWPRPDSDREQSGSQLQDERRPAVEQWRHHMERHRTDPKHRHRGQRHLQRKTDLHHHRQQGSVRGQGREHNRDNERDDRPDRHDERVIRPCGCRRQRRQVQGPAGPECHHRRRGGGLHLPVCRCDASGVVSGAWSTTVPTPSVPSKSDLNGGSKTIYYAVKRIATAAPNCESGTKVITVTISDSPMPDVTPGYYCEGETIADLGSSVKVNTQKKTADKYELLWYGTTKPASSADYAAGSTTVPATPAATVADSKTPNVMTYYVAQKDKETEAIGTASTGNHRLSETSPDHHRPGRRARPR